MSLTTEFLRADGTWIAPGVFSSTVAGQVPASGGGTANYLRADGTWASPPGAGVSPGSPASSVQYNNAGAFGGAAQFNIDGNGQPNVLAGFAYMYAGTDLAFQVPGGAGGAVNVFFGGAGNFTTTGYGNFGEGPQCMQNMTTGYYNMGEGLQSLQHCSTGHDNVGIGYFALNGVTSGASNTALGSASLYQLTTGTGNCAIGNGALANLIDGSDNLALGTDAMHTADSVNTCVAIGRSALYGIMGSGVSQNVAVGDNALNCGVTTANTVYRCVAIGAHAGYYSQGNYNVAIGTNAMQFAPSVAGSNAANTGSQNVAIGQSAMLNLTSASYNVAIGSTALSNLAGGAGANTGLGAACGGILTSGGQCIVIGSSCDFTSASANGQLVIANFLYGFSLTGTGATVSTGNMGVGTKTPRANVKLDVAGSVATAVYSAVTTAIPAAGNKGSRAFVSDATVATFGSAYTSGGTNNVPVWDNGTSWLIG